MRMRTTWCFCALVLAAATPTPMAGDAFATRAERAQALGEIWSHVSFLHPDVASNSRAAAWDRAFAAAVPALLAAADDADFERGTAALLATLSDPLTDIVAITAEQPPAAPREVPTRTIDAVLYVDLRDARTWPDLFSAQQRWRSLDEQLRKTESVVFDLRAGPRASLAQRISLAQSFLQSGVGVALGCIGLPGPTLRSRSYEGWRAEQMASGSFYPFFEVTASRPLAPLMPLSYAIPPEQNPFAVFLVDRETLLPECAVALEVADKAAFVAEGGVGDTALDPYIDLPLGAKHAARIRIARPLFSDGRPWRPRVTVVDEASMTTALDIARQRAVAQKIATEPVATDEMSHAPTFPGDALPAPGWRVIATARTCFIFSRFFPYRRLMEGSWREHCRAGYGAVLDAPDAEAYRVALLQLLVATGDSHVGFMGKAHPRDYGIGVPLLELRFIEGRPVVTQVYGTPPIDVAVGDEIVSVDGKPVTERIARLRELTPASTPQSQDGVVARRLLSGEIGTTVSLEVDGVHGRRSTSLLRAPPSLLYLAARVKDPAYRMQEPGIGYVDLTRLQAHEVPAMFSSLARAGAIVFDMRGYPQQTIWTIAPRLIERADIPAALIEQPVVRAMETTVDEDMVMGTISRRMQRLPPPVAPRWGGRSVMLMDDRSLSQAEHTGLWLRAANGTRFVGTATAGVNGTVTNFVLPGWITVSFTGVGIAWPDGTPLQRRGLQPDVTVSPTIAGIRAGRDEVLDAALRLLREEQPR